MPGPTLPPPLPNTLAIPMGFGAQIRALQECQHAQNLRISTLERENTELKACKPPPRHLLARIDALEAYNAHLVARRKEAVAQLLALRTLHQESANAFLVRAADVECDDLEGMLGVYGTAMTTVLNQHQRALGQMRFHDRMYAYPAAAGIPQGVAHGAEGYGCSYAYPPCYSQSGYCHAHQQPYACRVCGR